MSDVRRTLASLPRTLDETYERILARIAEHHETEALRLLQWLTYSNRPLRIQEVAEALAIVDLLERPHLDREKRLVDPHDTLTICSDLVVVSPIKVLSENGDTIEAEELRFAHFSVQEYLTSSRCSTGPLARYSIQQDANRIIALSCIGYLSSISANNLLEDDFQTHFPLYRYASHEWFYHVKKSPQQEDLDQLDTVVEHLLDPFYDDLTNWLRMFDPDRPWSLSLNPHKLRREACSALYYASSLGLLRTVRRLILHGAEVNWTGGSLGSPLQAAAFHGHRDVVTLLTEKGADCMIRCGYYGTALQAAKFAQHPDIIKDLEKYDCSKSPRDRVTSHIHLLQDEKAPFEVLDSIGGGGSGIVEKVRSLPGGRICVRKTCKTPTASARKAFLEEVRIMQKLQHFHVVEVLGSYSRGKSSSILLLPLADKDLEAFMETFDREVPSQVELLIKWTGCLVEGLRYIHSQQVKHKDIKPQNLLVHGEKILYTDFGIAHDFEGSVSVTAGNTGMTRRYSAPEVVAGDERSRAADVFSLGCVFLEMLGAILEWRLDGFADEDDYATYVQENRRGVAQGLNDIKAATETFQLRGFDSFPLVPTLTLSMLVNSPQDRPKASVLVSVLNGKGVAQGRVCC